MRQAPQSAPTDEADAVQSDAAAQDERDQRKQKP
jgi:hypothetical protein